MVAMATNAPEGIDETLPEPTSPSKDLASAAQKDATDGLTPQPSNSKIDVLLKAAGDAPIMSKRKWAVDRVKKVAWVIEFVRKYLKLEAQESLFLYVNQSFAPAPDVSVGTLFDCFGTDGKLVLHYCRTQAWG